MKGEVGINVLRADASASCILKKPLGGAEKALNVAGRGRQREKLPGHWGQKRELLAVLSPPLERIPRPLDLRPGEKGEYLLPRR